MKKLNIISYSLLVIVLVISFSRAHSTQRPSSREDDSNPFLDLASTFLQETLANQNGGNGGGIGGIASVIGSFMQPEGKSNGGGIGAAQILSGIGSLISNSNGGNGFDPSMIGNVIEMFTAGAGGGGASNSRQQRSIDDNEVQPQEGLGLDTILNVVSAFVNTNKNQAGRNKPQDEGFMSLLPMVMQAVNSFSGPEGEKTQAKHKEHAWVLPPFLEKIHVIWDHFSNSELAEALWKKSGVYSIFKVS